MSQSPMSLKLVADVKDLPAEDGNSSAESSIEMDHVRELDVEPLARQLIQNWLDEVGPKLFGLESAKFLARQAKLANIQRRPLPR